jgi:hypothetical protein
VRTCDKARSHQDEDHLSDEIFRKKNIRENHKPDSAEKQQQGSNPAVLSEIRGHRLTAATVTDNPIKMYSNPSCAKKEIPKSGRNETAKGVNMQ